MASSMQSCKYPDQHKNNETTDCSGNDIGKPSVMPCESFCEIIDDECQDQSSRAGDEQQDSGNIVSRLMQLSEIPAVRH